MSTLNDKRFAAIQTIHAKLYRLQSVMIEEIKTIKENQIDNIVSDPKFWCSRIESILAEPELLMPSSLVANPTVSQKRKIVGKTNVKRTSQCDLADRKTSETEAIVEKLKTAKSREEGKKTIENQTLTGLQSIAKQLNIPTGKLRKEQLLEKIVQDVVGYRLDFMIIQKHKSDMRRTGSNFKNRTAKKT